MKSFGISFITFVLKFSADPVLLVHVVQKLLTFLSFKNRICVKL